MFFLKFILWMRYYTSRTPERIYTVLGKKNPPGGFLAITCYHGHLQVPGQVEMVPIRLPKLPKPSRTLGESQKPIFQNQQAYIKDKQNKSNILNISFEGPQ